MRVASVIELSEEQQTRLLKVAQSQTASVRLTRRCGIVLLAADGYENRTIAEMLDVGRVQVGRRPAPWSVWSTMTLLMRGQNCRPSVHGPR